MIVSDIFADFLTPASKKNRYFSFDFLFFNQAKNQNGRLLMQNSKFSLVELAQLALNQPIRNDQK